MKYCVALSIAVATSMLAQAPAQEKKAEFVVASVKAANDDGGHDFDVDAGLMRIHNLTLKRLIANAYEVKDAEVLGGPNWLDKDTFDINAKIPAEFVALKPSRLPEMLRGLLADRFQLTVHREQRQVSGLELVVAKKGPKMEAAKPDEQDSHTNGSRNHLSAHNVSMEQFAVRLSRMPEIGQVVFDRTGLTSRYNFELDWLPERPDAKIEASPDDPPSIFVALQERLGLKLESAKIPIQAVVVDRAQRPDGN